VIRKITKPWTEVQLGFTFLTEEGQTSALCEQKQRRMRPKLREEQAKPIDLADALSLAQTHLLDASLDEVSAQLLPLLELCEATLTRALDVVAQREAEPRFSVEEQRSLRGIGQAQWLITEKLARRNAKGEEKIMRKKKMMNAEMDKG
jgi:hypothetical protein